MEKVVKWNKIDKRFKVCIRHKNAGRIGYATSFEDGATYRYDGNIRDVGKELVKEHFTVVSYRHHENVQPVHPEAPVRVEPEGKTYEAIQYLKAEWSDRPNEDLLIWTQGAHPRFVRQDHDSYSPSDIACNRTQFNVMVSNLCNQAGEIRYIAYVAACKSQLEPVKKFPTEPAMSGESPISISQPGAPTVKVASDYLKECVAVQEERGKQYDVTATSERSFKSTATAFNAITGSNLKGSDICLMLQILKDVRQYSNPNRLHEDSMLDKISYASLHAEELNHELK